MFAFVVHACTVCPAVLSSSVVISVLWCVCFQYKCVIRPVVWFAFNASVLNFAIDFSQRLILYSPMDVKCFTHFKKKRNECREAFACRRSVKCYCLHIAFTFLSYHNIRGRDASPCNRSPSFSTENPRHPFFLKYRPFEKLHPSEKSNQKPSNRQANTLTPTPRWHFFLPLQRQFC